MSRTSIRITVEDEETGEETTHELPARFEVCGRCEGHGTHLNPSIGNHAYTREEFEEAFDDEESRENYFKRGGIYDVSCEECGGQRVIPELDYDALTPAQKEIADEYYDRLEQEARWDAEDRMTRRMESGGYDY
jgi:hypothetical protein